MCILLFYTNPDTVPSSSSNQYKFILASNRDEFYNRASQPAAYWEEDPSILGGRDLGCSSKGTWLGISAVGKISVLLNIPGMDKHSATSRGVLPVKFLKSKQTAKEFVEHLINDGIYSGYNLLLFDIFVDDIVVNYHTNVNQSTSYNAVNELPKGFHVFGNQIQNASTEKSIAAKTLFEDIVTKYADMNKKEELIASLITLLKWDKCHVNDEDLKNCKNATDELIIKRKSSVYVSIPEHNYGTRTHTIILIDSNINAEFFEWTRKELLPDTEEEPWIYNHFHIPLQLIPS